MKTIVFTLFIYILPAFALGGYFSAKISGKDYHFHIGQNVSYLYQVGDSKTYFLKNEMLLDAVKSFEIFEPGKIEASVGIIKINEKSIVRFELNKTQAKNIKLKKLTLPVEAIVFTKQIYNNDKCSFKFINLNDIENIYLFKEVSFLISEIMDSFKEYECDYLKSNRSTDIKENLNQLVCDNETYFLKERFYGINFVCRGSLAQAKDFKFQAFSVIYDKILKARVLKTDFTSSDISAADDYRNLDFRLTAVGLGLYSSDMLQNKEEYLRIIPYVDLKKNFNVWGKPKRYLSNFSLK